MLFEDFVIGHALLKKLGEGATEHLLDLLWDPQHSVPTKVLEHLRRFLWELEAEFGEDHPVVLQVNRALRQNAVSR